MLLNLSQIGLTLEKAISVTREVDVQGSLFDNIVSLADFIMDGYSSQLKSLLFDENRQEDYMKLEREFEKERHKLILPLCKIQTCFVFFCNVFSIHSLMSVLFQGPPLIGEFPQNRDLKLILVVIHYFIYIVCIHTPNKFL